MTNEINEKKEGLNEKPTGKKNATANADDKKKKNQKANLERFKSQYFDYYDDIKISDRQDW